MCLGTATFCLCRKVAPRLSATWEPFAVCAPLSLSLSLLSALFPFPLPVYLRFSVRVFFAFCQLLRFVYRSRAAFDPSSLSPYLSLSISFTLTHSSSPAPSLCSHLAAALWFFHFLFIFRLSFSFDVL